MIYLNGLIESAQWIERISCLFFVLYIINVRRLAMILNDHLISLFNDYLVHISYDFSQFYK